MSKLINKSRMSFIGAMVIFGTIGIFRRFIPLSSSWLALIRGIIGTLFLSAFVLMRGRQINKNEIKNNFVLLLVSGAFIGFNWILLFESYNYTSVSVATLCYYMAPVFLTLASPVFLREKLSVKRMTAVFTAVLGMAFVSGVFKSGGLGGQQKGILFGLGAALFYASVIMLNKRMRPIDAYSKTVIQLASASLCVLPYVLLSQGIALPKLDGSALVLTLIVGVIHTGAAYALYFGSMKKLSAQSIAVFSYIDPVVAILLSALILKEPMGFSEILGAVLILGAAIYSELTEA